MEIEDISSSYGEGYDDAIEDVLKIIKHKLFFPSKIGLDLFKEIRCLTESKSELHESTISHTNNDIVKGDSKK